MNEDFRALVESLLDADARFLIVGAYAMAVHGVPRATGDLDVWISPDPSNAERVWRALQEFGAPTGERGVARPDLESRETVIRIGLPPRRIDLLTDVTGLAFDEAWEHRITPPVGGRGIPFLSREDLIRNKRATHRTKDLADLEILEHGEH